MSEAVEARVADLKSFVGLSLALILMTQSAILFVIGTAISSLPFTIIAFGLYIGAVIIWLAVRARNINGRLRKFIQSLGLEYKQPPIREWKEDLKERGEFTPGGSDYR